MAHDLRLQYRILLVRHLLDLKAVLFFLELDIQSFARFLTASETYRGFANSEQLKNSLFKRVLPLWNALPEKLKLGNQTYENVKKRLKTFLMKNLSMTPIDLNIVRNVGVNIISSSQILMLNLCFITIFCDVQFF